MSKPTDWEIETGYAGDVIVNRGRGPSYEKMRISEAERRINAHDGLVEALRGVKKYLESWGDEAIEAHEPECQAYKSICEALAAAGVKDETQDA